MTSEIPTKCDVCGKGKADGVDVQCCGRCKSRVFCGVDCQRADWPSHKAACKAKVAEIAARNKKWYDSHRACRDGTSHFGDLEFITWEGFEDGQRLGWGACVVSETAYLKRKFEEEYASDYSKMYRYWPQGFRWTCCGTAGDQKFGCDHHGTGPSPCQCDFCHMGKPLPDSIYQKDSVHRKGLQLPRGPDIRSFDPSSAAVADIARSFLGMPGH
ncbi:hypothetical protein F5B20DRAFT_147853 [Whalleya microplaca]|nr:hypothetical protein F5B20DRAFT_147853 [Whalleya microplaca]